MEEEKNFIGEELKGEFEGRQAEESDISGIQDLLKQLFLTGHVDCFELAKLIVSQNYIGFVLKQILDMDDDDDEEEEDDDDGFPTLAVCTIININNKKNDRTIGRLKEFLLKKSQQHNQQQHHQQLQDLFSAPTSIGLLINEKFLPDPKVAYPSLESLCKDMEKAVRKGMEYNFDKILIYSKTYTELHKKNNKSNKNNNNSKTRSYSDEELDFYNPEDRIFYELADWKFTFSVLGEHDSLIDMTSQEALANQQEPLRTLMLVSANKMSAILQSIKENL